MSKALKNKVKLNDIFNIDNLIVNGSGDNTATINAAILEAYKSAANVLTPNGEIYTVTVLFPPGKDIKVNGTILLPSQVVLDVNGSRLIGPDGSAGTSLYNPAGSHMIRTAYYNGTNLVENRLAVNEVTWRVVGAGVVNASFLNSNCPLDLTNFQEQCKIDNCRWSGCSAPLRVKNSFYARFGTSIVRNSAKAANQPAMLLWGAAAHELEIDIRFVDVAVGIEVTATNSFAVRVGGSFEEGYSNNSIGIKNNGSQCQAWSVVSRYFEGVRKGIVTINSGVFNGAVFAPGYFSSCEYAYQPGTSGFRACTIDGLSAPDEGAGIRNLVDLSAANLDVRVRVPNLIRSTSTGTSFGYPGNYLMGPGVTAMTSYTWVSNADNTDVLSLGNGGNANKNQIMQRNTGGRQQKTLPNQPVNCTLANPSTSTLTFSTNFVPDISDIYFFSIRVSDNDGTYVFRGRAYADFSGGTYTVVYDGTAPSKTLTFSTVSGFLVLTISGLNIVGGTYTVTQYQLTCGG